VSAVTFPAYFLKDADAAATVQMEIDLMLFGRQIAPFFHVNRRFIGTEPYCRTTRIYGETMRLLLPDYRIETVQLERLQAGNEAVSAWRVREALRREAFEELRRLVPKSTFDFLLSEAAREIRKKLRTYSRRH
jgi:[citrate (pro-3S)-lyase] ligase